MSDINLVCSVCQKNILRTKAEHNRRIKKFGQNYIIKCVNCRSVKHGKIETSEYRSWSAMKNRCNNKTFKHYDRYGGRGITYDSAWDDFSNFFKDMGEKPTPKHELERIDNCKNYSKENCVWATRKEQTRNRGGKRATRLYTYDGKTMCIKDWAEYAGISPSSMQKRLNNGWPLEKAFSKEKHDKPDLYTFKGETMSLLEWAKKLDIPKQRLWTRLKAGYPLEKVFTNEKFNRWNK